MAILADTSVMIAMLDRDDHHHTAVVEVIQTDTVLIPTTILPEVDYLATKYLGERVARSFLEAVIQGKFPYLSGHWWFRTLHNPGMNFFNESRAVCGSH
jgi:uncharacterized protein